MSCQPLSLSSNIETAFEKLRICEKHSVTLINRNFLAVESNHFGNLILIYGFPFKKKKFYIELTSILNLRFTKVET